MKIDWIKVQAYAAVAMKWIDNYPKATKATLFAIGFVLGAVIL